MACSGSAAVERYYQWHSRIYDATRWSFLFGRDRIIELAAKAVEPRRILEVGCGTGRNLLRLAARFPRAQLTGIDISGDMLNIARRKLAHLDSRVTFHQSAYDGSPATQPYDLILFSYSLSMFKPGWGKAITAATRDLTDNGVIAVVDFHHSKHAVFRRWMMFNHVAMDGHLAPVLRDHFISLVDRQVPAYAGLWQYLVFLGTRRYHAWGHSGYREQPVFRREFV